MELLAPAGNYEMLSTAIQAKVDAVYFGIQGLNMRANARNFTIHDLPEITKKCHDNNIKAYLAVNTIVFDGELEQIKNIIHKAAEAKVDSVICWDMAVLKLGREQNLPIHLSTQASASNSLAIEEYKKLGVTRVNLARECTLEEINNLDADVEVEVFIHGAMCVAVSGRCFMSQTIYGKSANRGECIQPCRRSYEIRDPETGKELELDNHYVMSPRDLCTIDIIEQLLESNITAFKIEGRNRSPEYVKKTVEAYKQAFHAYKNNQLTDELKQELKQKLRSVYNRDFSTGFYLGRPIEEWTDAYGSKSTHVKQFIGRVVNYYKKPGVAEIHIETGELQKGDVILIQGPTTGCIETAADSIQKEDQQVAKAGKGENIGVKTPLARKNDKVYVWRKREQQS